VSARPFGQIDQTSERDDTPAAPQISRRIAHAFSNKPDKSEAGKA